MKEINQIICKLLNLPENRITNIQVLKKGMTNRSYLFSLDNKKYILRIPGEGTDFLINRKEEAEVYKKIKELNLCDKIIYLNSNNGYKITEFIENATVCNPKNNEDLQKAMKKLRDFHQLNLKVKHEFNIFEKINFYESLWNGKSSVYDDYLETKTNVLSLKPFIEQNIQNKVLAHIDSVPDNFLFYKNQNNQEEIRLIDWEYSGMQDPHVDIAMFCIYAIYNKKEIDNLIDIYFNNNVDNNIRIKIYCYISACGLLWSNWCEYKNILGVDFGEYSLKQYEYAKEYYKIANKIIKDSHLGRE